MISSAAGGSGRSPTKSETNQNTNQTLVERKNSMGVLLPLFVLTAGKQNAPSGWTGALHGEAEPVPGGKARRGEISPVDANCSSCAERWKGASPSLQPPFPSQCLRVRCDPFRRDGRADSIPGRRGRAKPLLGWV